MSFLEEYTLLDKLGQGGEAEVFKVRHNKLDYVRAIRVLKGTITRGEDDIIYQKFLKECRLLLRLGNGNNPNIVHIYKPELKEQRAFVEMDFVDGKNLSHYLEEKHSFIEYKDVLRLLRDIGSALAYCHEDIYKFCMDRNKDNLKDDPNDGSKVLLDEETKQRLIEDYRVIHNDIHSGNIIRREDGAYVLLDFGFAIVNGNVSRASQILRLGVPEFIPPEKWDNEKILTPQSDIYSFGVVLYEYLAGRVPFKLKNRSGQALNDLIHSHKKENPPSIFEFRKAAFEHSHPGETYDKKDYPEWLEMLIMKCLSKSAKDRFKNGKELYSFVLEHINDETNSQIEDLKKEIVALQNKNVEYNKLRKKIKTLEDRLKETEDELLNTPNKQRRKLKVWAILSIAFFLTTCIASYMYLSNNTGNVTDVKDKIIDYLSEVLPAVPPAPKGNGNTGEYSQSDIDAKNKTIKSLNTEIDKAKDQLKAKDNRIATLTKRIDDLNKKVSELESKQITGEYSQSDIDAKNKTIESLNFEISILRSKIKETDRFNNTLMEEIRENY